MKTLFRALFAVLFLLALATVAIYHVGGKQMEYKAEVTIKGSSLEYVMQHLSEPELVKLWAGGVVDIEAETQVDTEIGAEGTLTVESANGQTTELTNQVLATSDRSLTVRTTGKNFETFSIWKLTPQGNDIQVRQLMLGTHHGLARLEAPFYREDVEQQMQADLDRLASVVEFGPVIDDEREQGHSETETGDDGDDESEAGENDQQAL